MKIKFKSDKAAPIAFFLATIFLYLITKFGRKDDILPGEYYLPMIYAGITILLTLACVRGRKVPDNSCYYCWRDVGMDGFAIIGGGILLAFGGRGIFLALFWNNEL